MGLGEGGRKRATAMWYLVGLPSYKNLREKLKELMARKQKLLPQVEVSTSKAIADKVRGAPSACVPSSSSAPVGGSKSFRHMSLYPRVTPSRSMPIPSAETPSQISRSNRSARYEAVRTSINNWSPSER